MTWLLSSLRVLTHALWIVFYPEIQIAISESGELPDRILDSHFTELMADPVLAVEKLYGQIDRPFVGEHADAIRDYIASKPKGKFGQHKYSPEEWGFDPALLREKMLPYTDHYGITLED